MRGIFGEFFKLFIVCVENWLFLCFLLRFLGMSEEMFQDGYERIISMDISENVVNFMMSKCRNKRDDFKCKF